MKKYVAVAYCLSVFVTLTPMASAKSVPLEAPDPARGVIGVTVNVVAPSRMGSSIADAVYFVRVVENADRFGAESLILSTYAKGNNVYLLNAKPGRYVAVGASFSPNGLTLGASAGAGVVAFSQPDILKTEVEVRAGAVVFMGAIEVQSSTKIQDADGAQSHYLRMISPKGATQGFMARAFTGHFIYIGAFKDVERDTVTETKFWSEAAEKHFKHEQAWASHIAGRSATSAALAAGSTPVAAITVTPRGSTNVPVSGDEFLSGVCVGANTAKARANGQSDDAETSARLTCQTVMTDWDAHACGENPDQDPCKKRLASMDGSLKLSGSSMLFAAAQAGQTSICSVMIAMGSDPNAAISNSWTPLMIAAAENRSETVKLLLEKGANPNAMNTDGKSATMIAAEYGHSEMSEQLATASAAAR